MHETNIIDLIINFEEEELLSPISKPIVGILRESGCVECISHTGDGHGYYHCERNGKSYKVHRYIFIKYCEEIPEGEFVMHKCDNPHCINPDHLMHGTPKDNVDDMVRKNRHIKGSASPNSKLTEENVYFIRFVSNDSVKKLAKQFNVSKGTIRNIRKNKIWKHVTEDYKLIKNVI